MNGMECDGGRTVSTIPPRINERVVRPLGLHPALNDGAIFCGWMNIGHIPNGLIPLRSPVTAGHTVSYPCHQGSLTIGGDARGTPKLLL